MRVQKRVARRESRPWEHVALAWLLAMGIAVACTLVRFPPGRPLRFVRVPPPAWRAQMGPRWIVLVATRERALFVGWIVAPLGALAVSAAAIARARRP